MKHDIWNIITDARVDSLMLELLIVDTGLYNDTKVSAKVHSQRQR